MSHWGSSIHLQHAGSQAERQAQMTNAISPRMGAGNDEWQHCLLDVLPVHHLCQNAPVAIQALIFSPENRGPTDAKAYVFWHVRGESDKIKFSCHPGWRELQYVIVFSSCFELALPFYLPLLEMTSFSQTLPLPPPPRMFSKHEPHGSASLVPLCPSLVDTISYSSGSWFVHTLTIIRNKQQTASLRSKTHSLCWELEPKKRSPSGALFVPDT